jgi:hypothetical protein
MTDHTNMVSRRTALKGLAGFAGTSAVGVGSITYAAEPAAAQVNNGIEIDDLTIDLQAGEDEAIGLSEIGLSDLWFEAYWESITSSLIVDLTITEITNTWASAVLDFVDLGVDGDGTETFGYGDTYADSYTVDLNGGAYFDGATPLHTDPNDTQLLNQYQLESGETEKTVSTRISLSLWLADEDGSQDVSALLENTEESFDITLQRVEPTGGVSDGEGEVYGEN